MSSTAGALCPDLHVALEAATVGAAAICSVHSPTSDHAAPGTAGDVRSKGGVHSDLVTAADVAADRAIHQHLRRMRPADQILSEELNPDWQRSGPPGATGDGAGPRTGPLPGRWWVVDPLDATSGFLFGVGEDYPSVMVALCVDSIPQVAVIVFPLSGRKVYAVRGEGCFRDGSRVTVTPPPGLGDGLRDAWVDINQYTDGQLETEAVRRADAFLRRTCRLVTRMCPHSGAVARLLGPGPGLAAIVHDHNPQHPKQQPWDILPALLVLVEAGGSVRQLGGQPLDPFQPKGPFVMARSAAMAEAIVAAMEGGSTVCRATPNPALCR